MLTFKNIYFKNTLKNFCYTYNLMFITSIIFNATYYKKVKKFEIIKYNKPFILRFFILNN